MSKQLSLGAAAPWFRGVALQGNPKYEFSSVAGRYVLMLFVGSAGSPAARMALTALERQRHLFDDDKACFFGVTSDPEDETHARIAQQLPGIRWFLDYDRAIARRYGLLDQQGDPVPIWVLLDPMLRVVRTAPVDQPTMIFIGLAAELAKPEDLLQSAPVLVLPNIFDRELCRHLIGLYDAHGGTPSGFMREVNGVTTAIQDAGFKRRRDFPVNDPQLREQIVRRIATTLVPAIYQAFQFRVTRMERYIVACYDGDSGGFFRPHRDNTTHGTAHRRFACTINLNTEDYEGGELRFPEFGNRTYRAPTGGAVIFSCSLLHEATPVTSGRRYAYLPFFYDDEAAQQREAYAKSEHANPALAGYRA